MQAYLIGLRGNKYLGASQPRPPQTSRDLPEFGVCCLSVYGGQTTLYASPDGVMGQIHLNQSLSLKCFPCYGSAWGSTLTAVRVWSLGGPLVMNLSSFIEFHFFGVCLC